MKRLLFVLMIVMLTIVLTSCDGADVSQPDIADIYTEDYDQDFYLIINASEFAGYSENLGVILISCHEVLELKLNETGVLLEDYIYDLNSGYYVYSANLQDIIGRYDDEISYQLSLDDRVVEGSLRMPSKIIIEYPPVQDSQDYQLAWSLTNDPKLLDIAYTLQVGNGFYHYQYDLDPGTRQYQIDKSAWEPYGELSGANIYLTAANYRYRAGGLIWYRAESVYYGDSGKSTAGSGPTDLLQRLTSKQLKLPPKKPYQIQTKAQGGQS